MACLDLTYLPICRSAPRFLSSDYNPIPSLSTWYSIRYPAFHQWIYFSFLSPCTGPSTTWPLSWREYEPRWSGHQSFYLSIKIPFPLFGVTHGFEILFYFENFLLFVGRYLEPIDGLEKIDLFIEGFLEGLFPLLLCQRLIIFYFLQFCYSPHLQIVKKVPKVPDKGFRNPFVFLGFFFFRFPIYGEFIMFFLIRFILQVIFGTDWVFGFWAFLIIFERTSPLLIVEWTGLPRYAFLTTFNYRNTFRARLLYPFSYLWKFLIFPFESRFTFGLWWILWLDRKFEFAE